MLISASIKIFMAAVFMLISALLSPVFGDSYFGMATSQVDLPKPVKRGFIRWETESLKFGFYVIGENPDESILNKLNDGFEMDRKILEHYSGIDIQVGLWGDTDPVPQVFIVMGTTKQILREANDLGDRFQEKDLRMRIGNHVNTDTGACFRVVKYNDDGEIIITLIGVDIDKQPAYCLRRQIYTSLGFLGNLPEMAPSILAKDGVEKNITELDRYMLRELYLLPSNID